MFRLFAAMMLMLVPAGLSAQEEEAVPTAEMLGLYGITLCHGDQAAAFVRMGLSKIEDADTRAHEAKHLEQMARFDSCKAFLKYYRTPVGMLSLEAEAYAAGGCAAMALGADPISRLQLYADKIEYTLGGGMLRLVVIQELQKYWGKCG